MLDKRRTVFGSFLIHITGDRNYCLLQDGSSVQIYDNVTGYLVSSIDTRGLLPPDVSGMEVMGNKLIFYNGNGTFTFFDINKGCVVYNLSMKIKNNKMNIVKTVACRYKDDMIFVMSPGSSTLSAIYISSSNAFCRTGIRIPDSLDKNRNDIVKVLCHPVKPYVLVCFSKGSVQVWNYIAVRKHLTASTESGHDGSGVGGFDDGDGDSEDDNSEDDERSKKKKTKIEKELLPVALLCVSDKDAGKSFADATMSACGRMCAVTWGNTVAVYNVELNKKQRAGTIIRLLPLGSFTIAPSMDFNAFGPMAFHPSEPILFQVGCYFLFELCFLPPVLLIYFSFERYC